MIGGKQEFLKNIDEIKTQIESAINFQKKIKKINYSAVNLNIEPRIINQWQGKNLLFNEIIKGSKYNYSFLDCVWLKCIQKMREFGIDYKIISAFKKNLMHRIENVSIKPFLDNGALMESLKSIDTTISENDLIEIISKIKPEDFHVDINILEMSIFDMFLNKLSYTFKINEKGNFIYIKEGKEKELINEISEYSDFLNGSYYNLSLSEILCSVLWEGIDFDFIATDDMTTLSKEELAILKDIRNKRFNTIEIIFDKKNPEIINFLKSTEEGYLDISKRFADMFFKGKYNEMNIISINGEIIHYKNTHITKF